MIDLLQHKEKVDYYLSSATQPRTRIPEPKGYEDGNRVKYERDEDSKGFLNTTSNDLEYHGEGAAFLVRQLTVFGSAYDVLQEKEIRSDDRIDELVRSTVPVYLNVADIEEEEKLSGRSVVKTKVVQGGLKKLIESRKDDVYDLTALVDSFGNTIPALQTENIYLEPREIFLESTLSVLDNTEIGAAVSGGDNLNARAVPFVVDKNSDANNIDFVIGDQLSAASNNYAALSGDKIGNCFITTSDNNKLLKINGKVKLTIIDSDAVTGPNHMDIVIYDGFGDFRFKQAIRLVDFDPSNLGEVIEYTFNDYELEVKLGESVTIGLLSDTADGIRYRVTETEIVITEDSIYPASNCRCLTYGQAINRLLYIITGKDNLLVSNLLTTGELSEDLITSGFWARQFPDVINEGTDEERKIPFNLSLAQILDHIEYLVPKAYWVDNPSNQELMYLEPFAYTQQNFEGVHIGTFDDNGNRVYFEANNIKRPTIKKNLYGKIIIGSEKSGGLYEEVVGLRSIIGRAEFTTFNKNSKEKYEKTTPFRCADIDIEIPRRMPFELFPEEDTRYDSDICMIRAKKVGSSYALKRWQDAFVSAPTGIYRPNSAYNLEITPAQQLLAHGRNIATAVYRYPAEKIVLASSNSNTAYKSQKTGEELLGEDVPILNTRLGVPHTKPRMMECNVQITQEIEDILTSANKDGVPNWFGLIVVNTGQINEFFRLKEADPNKEGTLKLVEAYL